MTPRALIFATGAHDGVLLFPGNDLPGVMSARAAAMLARGGIVLGDEIALLGQGAYAAALLEHLQSSGVQILTAPAPSLVAAHGRARVTGVSLRNPGGTASPKRHRVDALVIDAPGAPSFELAQQAGASIRFAASAGGTLR